MTTDAITALKATLKQLKADQDAALTTWHESNTMDTAQRALMALRDYKSGVKKLIDACIENLDEQSADIEGYIMRTFTQMGTTSMSTATHTLTKRKKPAYFGIEDREALHKYLVDNPDHLTILQGRISSKELADIMEQSGSGIPPGIVAGPDKFTISIRKK